MTLPMVLESDRMSYYHMNWLTGVELSAAVVFVLLT